MKLISRISGLACGYIIGLYLGKLLGKLLIFLFGDLLIKLMYVNINWLYVFLVCLAISIISYLLKRSE